MKILFLVFISLCFNLVSPAQTLKCQSVHEGTFRIVDSLSGTTILKRTKDLQIEENAEMGIKMIFDIKWINDCTYELRPKEVVKGDPAMMGKKGDAMTVTITEIKAHSYVSVTTANFADFVMKKEIEILQ